MLTMSKRQLWPILVEHMEFSVNIILYQQQSLLRHFLSVAIDQLDAIVVVRVVAGGDHNAAVEVIYTSDVSHRRSGSDMEQICICTRSGQPSDQAVLEHIGAAAGVLANDDAGGLVVAVARAQCVIISAQKTANLVGMVGGQINTSFPTEAVRSEIFTHFSFSLQ